VRVERAYALRLLWIVAAMLGGALILAALLYSSRQADVGLPPPPASSEFSFTPGPTNTPSPRQMRAIRNVVAKLPSVRSAEEERIIFFYMHEESLPYDITGYDANGRKVFLPDEQDKVAQIEIVWFVPSGKDIFKYKHTIISKANLFILFRP